MAIEQTLIDYAREDGAAHAIAIADGWTAALNDIAEGSGFPLTEETQQQQSAAHLLLAAIGRAMPALLDIDQQQRAERRAALEQFTQEQTERAAQLAEEIEQDNRAHGVCPNCGHVTAPHGPCPDCGDPDSWTPEEIAAQQQANEQHAQRRALRHAKHFTRTREALAELHARN